MFKSVIKSVTWHDTGWKRIKDGLTELTRTVVRVGVMNDDATRTHPLRNTLTVGEVAQMQEYGSRAAGIPARSYVKSTVHEHQKEVKDGMAVVVRTIVSGSSSWAGLFSLGERFKKYIVDKVMSGDIPPPLAPFTVQMKGHDRTLQDTLTLARSISHEITTRAALAGRDESGSE